MAGLGNVISGAADAFKQVAAAPTSGWNLRGNGAFQPATNPLFQSINGEGQGRGSMAESWAQSIAPRTPPNMLQNAVNQWNATAPYMSASERAAKEMQQNAGQNMSATNSVGGSSYMSSLGGDWSGVDKWNPQIQQAANKYGVPANLIKAVMKLESGGANVGTNGAGAIGPMQVVGSIWGNSGYDLFDPAQNIMAGAMILKQNYDQYAGWAQANGMDPWQAAIMSYYAGNPYNPNAHDNVSDGGSGMPASSYVDQIWGAYQSLNGSPSGGMSGQMAPNGGSFGVTSVVGGGASYDWGSFGAPSGNGLYGYGTSYGLNGAQHTGIDIAAPVGAPEYAAMGGTVMCAGTGVGSGTDGGGCAAFNYVPNFDGAPQAGNGNGRIEILLDNGAVLIYGHSLSAGVQPGQRVQAGQVIGQSGGMNSAHTHLEARVRDSSMPSGWRIVDPATVLGAGFTSTGSSATYGQTTTGGTQGGGNIYTPTYSRPQQGRIGWSGGPSGTAGSFGRVRW